MAAPSLAVASSDLSRNIKRWEGGRQAKVSAHTRATVTDLRAWTLIRMLTDPGPFQNPGRMENELRKPRVGWGWGESLQEQSRLGTVKMGSKLSEV